MTSKLYVYVEYLFLFLKELRLMIKEVLSILSFRKQNILHDVRHRPDCCFGPFGCFGGGMSFPDYLFQMSGLTILYWRKWFVA